mgnify:CR=1 FL=1
MISLEYHFGGEVKEKKKSHHTEVTRAEVQVNKHEERNSEKLGAKAKVITGKENEAAEQSNATKVMTYKELKELQSKLTLVATDRQKDNLEIIEAFDVVRITQQIIFAFNI